MASTISDLNLWVHFQAELLYHLKKKALNYYMQLVWGEKTKGGGGRQGKGILISETNKKMQRQLDWSQSPKKEASLQEGQDNSLCC